MNKTIGVVAHVDAGKTTFSESLLYNTNTIREKGRVDYKNSYLDSHEIERQRGITIFADEGIINYKGHTYYLIDTPGHVDFSAEMERSVMIMDYAIVILSAVEGVQGHTETVYSLLKKHKVPTFFFINKVDRVGANVNKVINEIKENLTKDICFIKESLEDNLSESLIENIAEVNEELLELYMDGNYNKEKWIHILKSMIQQNEISLCSSGSALKDEGVMEFFHNIHMLTNTKYSDDNDFIGQVYKISHDNITKITHMKVLQGNISVRDEIKYMSEETEISEKITQIRVYNGSKFKTVDKACAGELIGALGITKTWAGQCIGEESRNNKYEMISTLKSKVIFHESLNIKEMVEIFKILDEEDPSLKFEWDENLKEMHIHVSGPIQLEILKNIVKERFHKEISFGEPNILYKETIHEATVGYGHFEPLGHYSEVHLKIEPKERNMGISYKNNCHVDHLTKGNQNLVKHHLFEREHKGILTGSPITDINVTLITGRAHKKHTSGGDFRQATCRALRQGLEKVENILLEPYYNFKIKVNIDYIGRVLSDIQQSSGTFEPPITINDTVQVKGRVPVSTFMNYPMTLAAFTKGKGVISVTYGGYDKCHNSDEIIEKINYDKNADIEYTSSSIFCSKGQAYVVEWDKAEEQMHCIDK